MQDVNNVVRQYSFPLELHDKEASGAYVDSLDGLDCELREMALTAVLDLVRRHIQLAEYHGEQTRCEQKTAYLVQERVGRLDLEHALLAVERIAGKLKGALELH